MPSYGFESDILSPHRAMDGLTHVPFYNQDIHLHHLQLGVDIEVKIPRCSRARLFPRPVSGYIHGNRMSYPPDVSLDFHSFPGMSLSIVVGLSLVEGYLALYFRRSPVPIPVERCFPVY